MCETCGHPRDPEGHKRQAKERGESNFSDWKPVSPRQILDLDEYGFNEKGEKILVHRGTNEGR